MKLLAVGEKLVKVKVGCMKTENLIDKKFGSFVVVKRFGSDRWGRATWECRCCCGSKRVVASHNLKSGLVTSCGCSRRKRRKTTSKVLKILNN